MSDEKIINFEDAKNRVKEDDLNLFEKFMTEELLKLNLNGDIDIFEFAKRVSEYQKEHDIPSKKFMEIQTKLMERYGFDISSGYPESLKDLDSIKNLKDPKKTIMKDPEEFMQMAANLGLNSIFQDKVEDKKITQLDLKNDKNDLRMIFNDNYVTVISEKKIDFSDSEVNKAIAWYREIIGKSIKIQICEATNSYDYK